MTRVCAFFFMFCATQSNELTINHKQMETIIIVLAIYIAMLFIIAKSGNSEPVKNEPQYRRSATKRAICETFADDGGIKKRHCDENIAVTWTLSPSHFHYTLRNKTGREMIIQEASAYSVCRPHIEQQLSLSRATVYETENKSTPTVIPPEGKIEGNIPAPFPPAIYDPEVYEYVKNNSRITAGLTIIANNRQIDYEFGFTLNDLQHGKASILQDS